jgi:hypothetical protein
VESDSQTRSRRPRSVLLGLALLICSTARSQTSLCDLNNDGTVNSVDVQQAVDMISGLLPCTANIEGFGVCTDDVVSRIVSAALGGTCITGTGNTVSHSVTLTWTASTSPNLVGYNIYRSGTSGGPYTKINSAPIAAISFVDTGIQAGQPYDYVVTAVDNSGNESAFSNQAEATVPSP